MEVILHLANSFSLAFTMVEENFKKSPLKMLEIVLHFANFVITTFTMIEELKIHLSRCTRMTFNLTNFVMITFTMVEENFKNSPSKMLQNGPQSN